MVVPPEEFGVTTVVVELLGWGVIVSGTVVVVVVVELPSEFTVVTVELVCACAIGAAASPIARARANAGPVRAAMKPNISIS